MKINVNNIVGKVNGFISNEKSKRELYQQKLNQSLIFQLNNTITINEENLVMGNWYEYTEMCSYINIKQAKLIDSLTPINEVVVYIVHVTQKRDDKEFVLVLTNLRVIIMNDDKYAYMNYSDISLVEIISNSLFTQIINFGGVILGVDLEQNDMNIFYSIISNLEYRNNCIKEKIKYLCGINPIYQRLNELKSGISMDENNNIVFHDKKINNYLCKYDDIVNYEILEDNTPVLKRKTREQSHAMGFTKKECSKMTMRVTLKDETVFEIELLEQKIFSGTYDHNDTNYVNHFNFAKELMDKLDSLNKELF